MYFLDEENPFSGCFKVRTMNFEIPTLRYFCRIFQIF